MIHKTTVEVDEYGDHFIVFSPEAIAQVGWKIGDNIKWTDNNNGSWTMSKVEKTEYVLVEAIGQFRMRYVVEVPAGQKEWACDAVIMEQAKEFSQFSLGETITSARVIAQEDIIPLCDEDNEYAKSWNDELKMNSFVTKWKDIKDV